MPLQVVYVLTNPAMPGFIKIGKTLIEDVNQRLGQLYTTGVPFPFELAYACKVPNADELMTLPCIDDAIQEYPI